MAQTNQDIAAVLYEMAELFDMNDMPFKPRAFEKAARSIETMQDSVSGIFKKDGKIALQKIPGVGEGIADRIIEYIKTGRIRDHDAMKKKMPVRIAELSAIEGVGPKMIKELYQKLKIKTRVDLECAARAGKLRTLPRFGKKLEAKILRGIAFQNTAAGRIPLGEALPYARRIIQRLKDAGAVDRIALAGSCARWQETVGDIDMVATSAAPKKTMDVFAALPEIKKIIAKGETKTTARLRIGIDIDIRVVPDQSFGSATQYFVGNKDHNIALRTLAEKKRYKLNEYGLFKGNRQIACADEKEIYKKLGLDPIPFELRRGIGEISSAQKHTLPRLIQFGEVRGDLQTQTYWTDGEHSIEEMAHEAARLGREYIAITDHTKALAMTGGSDEKKLRQQMIEIKKINANLRKEGIKIVVLCGAEVNILKDGSLDIDDETLAQLDVVGAAVHSSFNLPEKEQTERMIRAIENPNVDILFHPTGRVFNKLALIA